jgi:hypothetical protein
MRGERKGTWIRSSLVGVALFAGAAEPSGAGSPEARDKPPPNFRIGDAYAQMAVRRAAARASLRLARPACQRLLTDFTDAAGRPLRATLEERGFAPETYFQHMRFYDGTAHPRCEAPDIFAITLRPGSRLVYVCPSRFLHAFRKNPGLAEAYLIHEMLHSLGLGENPPSSQEITNRVIDRCRP